MPGIRMSRKAICGCHSPNSASAWLPSAASATMSSSGHASASFSFSRSRISGSSSAINAVGRFIGAAFSMQRRRRCAGRRGVERQDEARDESARMVGVGLERGTFAVLQRQPFADVGEADAVHARRAGQPSAGVRRPTSAMRAPSACASRVAVTSMRPPSGSGSMPCLIAFSTSVISMPGRHGGVLEALRNGDRPLEPAAQARLHDAQVRADHQPRPAGPSSRRRAASASSRAGSGSGR